MQITQQVVVVAAALTVRFHLRLADPRHWPALRAVVVLIASLVIAIPLAQHCASYRRLTDVQTLNDIEHPALILLPPPTWADFNAKALTLKDRVDNAQKKSDSNVEGGYEFD